MSGQTANDQSTVKKDQACKRELVGKVVSGRMDKSRLVRIESLVKHGRYGKHLVQSNKVMVHDESNQTRVGDKVLIRECRPISKRKSWILKKVLEKAHLEAAEEGAG